MTELLIDDSAVRWAHRGASVGTDDAVRALACGAPLLLLMHGYGSFEGDLIELAPGLPADFVCASPRAPLTAPPPVVDGFAWFPIAFTVDGRVEQTPPPERFEGTAPHSAALAMLAWVNRLEEAVRAAGGAGLGTVVPMGFSQGGAMAVSLLRLRPDAFPCAVNCSGFVAPGSADGDERLLQTRPPIFWGRDPADPIIDAPRITHAAGWLSEHARVTARVYPGIGHAISAEEVADISVFLKEYA